MKNNSNMYITRNNQNHGSMSIVNFAMKQFVMKKMEYCTIDNYHWICENCFNDFKDMFKWTVV